MDAALTRLHRRERMLTGADVAVRYGIAAHALRAERKVFTLTTRDGLRLYPEVQFDGEGPLPVVAMAVRALARRGYDQDEICAWFFRPTAALQGNAPADVLHDEPHWVASLALDAEDDHGASERAPSR